MIDIKFTSSKISFNPSFEKINGVSDSGYERGFTEGYESGKTEGLTQGERFGYADALAKRTDLLVTKNGDYTPTGESTGFKRVSVSVPERVPILQEKTCTENGEVVADKGYDGLSKVMVAVKTGGGGINKLPQIIGRTVTKLTAEDLQAVTSIGTYAFYDCRELTSIVIPGSVTSIGTSAFSNCYALETVYYGGTAEQWAAIEISSNNDYLLNANIIFLGEKPSSKGLKFTSNGDDTCYVADIGTCTDTDIVIPRHSPAGDLVTAIGEDAFSYCPSLTSIEIPTSVTTIGEDAFYNCDSLTSIEIPASVTAIGNSAFGSCESLASIEIPASVTTIGDYAFSNCTSLTSIEIPTSVTSIGFGAFRGCTSLTSITFAENSQLTSIGEYAFSYCTSLTSIEIPASVTSIDGQTFYECSALASVTFEEGSQLTSIGIQAFYYCTSLTSIEIPSSVTSIGTKAFAGNWDHHMSLERVTFEEGSQLTTIGNYAFAECGLLTHIKIPASVTSIGEYAFAGSNSIGAQDMHLESVIFEDDSKLISIGDWAFYKTKLKSIDIPDRVSSIGRCAFYQCGSLQSIKIPVNVTTINADTFSGCASLTSVTFAEGSRLTSIGDSAFRYCTSLASIEIPASVTSIGEWAFAASQGANAQEMRLERVAFEDDSQLTSIGDYAFYRCSILASITIPSGVTSIGSHAFASCTALHTVTIQAHTPPTLDSYVFGTIVEQIIVPIGTRETYINAMNWDKYADKIVEGEI